MSTDLDLIREAALEAGRMALDLRARGLKVEWKPGNTPVTNGDLAVDAFLNDQLLAARPDYGWLSEETADDPARLQKSRLFIVDPIDGTTAYVKGKPWFTVCIAVVEEGHPTAGVVFAPELDQRFEAAVGAGASLNGSAIQVSDREQLEDCAMLGDVNLFSHPKWERPWPAMRVETRNSVAYRLALVAAGRFDAVFAPSPKHDWDLAAADLIAREAGAVVTDHKGRPFLYNQPVPKRSALIGAGPALHRLLVERTAHIPLQDWN